MNNELGIKTNKPKRKAECSKLKTAGFTLVETLIAIAILVIAIVGPLTIASNSLTAAYYASDQVTAFYLAQEGVEYARFLRDYNFINQANGRIWDQGIKDACGSVICRMDSTAIFSGGTSLNAFSVCSSVSDCNLQKDSSGVFHQVIPGSDSSLTPTNFYRTITVNSISSVEDRVIVSVYWTTGNLKSPNNFQIGENIFNWDSSLSSGGGGPGPSPVVNITAADDSLKAGFSTTINWTSTNNPTSLSFYMYRTPTSCPVMTAPNPSPASVSSGSASVTVPAGANTNCHYNFEFSAANSAGRSATSTATIGVCTGQGCTGGGGGGGGGAEEQ